MAHSWKARLGPTLANFTAPVGAQLAAVRELAAIQREATGELELAVYPLGIPRLAEAAMIGQPAGAAA